MSLQVCEFHLDVLRTVIARMGMTHLNSQDPEDTAQRIIESSETKTFRIDPFRVAQSLLLQSGIKTMGLAALGDRCFCPCCHARARYEQEMSKPVEIRPRGLPWDTDLIEKTCRIIHDEAVAQGKL